MGWVVVGDILSILCVKLPVAVLLPRPVVMCTHSHRTQWREASQMCVCSVHYTDSTSYTEERNTSTNAAPCVATMCHKRLPSQSCLCVVLCIVSCGLYSTVYGLVYIMLCIVLSSIVLCILCCV